MAFLRYSTFKIFRVHDIDKGGHLANRRDSLFFDQCAMETRIFVILDEMKTIFYAKSGFLGSLKLHILLF